MAKWIAFFKPKEESSEDLGWYDHLIEADTEDEARIQAWANIEKRNEDFRPHILAGALRRRNPDDYILDRLEKVERKQRWIALFCHKAYMTPRGQLPKERRIRVRSGCSMGAELDAKRELNRIERGSTGAWKFLGVELGNQKETYDEVVKRLQQKTLTEEEKTKQLRTKRRKGMKTIYRLCFLFTISVIAFSWATSSKFLSAKRITNAIQDGKKKINAVYDFLGNDKSAVECRVRIQLLQSVSVPARWTKEESQAKLEDWLRRHVSKQTGLLWNDEGEPTITQFFESGKDLPDRAALDKATKEIKKASEFLKMAVSSLDVPEPDTWEE